MAPSLPARRGHDEPVAAFFTHMKTTAVTLMNPLRHRNPRSQTSGFLPPTRHLMKKLSYATVILLGSAAMAISSRADSLLVGDISTLVRARFNNVDPQSSDGGTVALTSGSNSYVASQTRDDDFVSATGATQISNNDGADVAKISFTAAINLSAQSPETDMVLTSSLMSATFSVTAPVTYLIQGDFKGELSAGEIGAYSGGSLLFQDSPTTRSFSYLEVEDSKDAGVFHHVANLANDGNAADFSSAGALTGILLPGIDYLLTENYDMSEGFSSVGVSGFSSGNYSITFTRLNDDGTGGGGGGGGGGGSTSTVPDSGSSAGLVSLGMVVLAVIRRRT